MQGKIGEKEVDSIDLVQDSNMNDYRIEFVFFIQSLSGKVVKLILQNSAISQIQNVKFLLRLK